MKIAIDGMAATGKGTLARGLSEKLGLPYFDSGKLYRYAVYYLISQNYIVLNSNLQDIQAIMADDDIKLQLQKDILMHVNQLEDLSKKIHFYTPEISQLASKISTIAEFRKLVIKPQQVFMQQKSGAIMDGRDIGSVICPEADIKFFLTATADIRAERRYMELQKRNISTHYETILEEIKQRDKRDSEREAAPLKKTDDAIIIDTSDKEIKEMLEVALKHVIKHNSKL